MKKLLVCAFIKALCCLQCYVGIIGNILKESWKQSVTRQQSSWQRRSWAESMRGSKRSWRREKWKNLSKLHYDGCVWGFFTCVCACVFGLLVCLSHSTVSKGTWTSGAYLRPLGWVHNIPSSPTLCYIALYSCVNVHVTLYTYCEPSFMHTY